MGNHQIGSDILQFLKRVGENVVWSTIAGSPLSSDSRLVELQPDIGISIMYPHIIPAPTIELFPAGIINLHPSLLPYCRGGYPALWSIIEHNPAGVTLHYIDASIDTGDIIAQQWVRYDDYDTCRDIYDYCVQIGYWVFARAWSSIVGGSPKRIPQPQHKATFHLKSEVEIPDYWFSKTVREIRNEWGKGVNQ